MNVKNSLKKIAKLSAFFSTFILILAFIKSYLKGDFGSLTVDGFFQAILISIATGTVAAIALHLKDEKDKK